MNIVDIFNSLLDFYQSRACFIFLVLCFLAVAQLYYKIGEPFIMTYRGWFIALLITAAILGLMGIFIFHGNIIYIYVTQVGLFTTNVRLGHAFYEIHWIRWREPNPIGQFYRITLFWVTNIGVFGFLYVWIFYDLLFDLVKKIFA